VVKYGRSGQERLIPPVKVVPKQRNIRGVVMSHSVKYFRTVPSTVPVDSLEERALDPVQISMNLYLERGA
jgi:hypothetical protein